MRAGGSRLSQQHHLGSPDSAEGVQAFSAPCAPHPKEA